MKRDRKFEIVLEILNVMVTEEERRENLKKFEGRRRSDLDR